MRPLRSLVLLVAVALPGISRAEDAPRNRFLANDPDEVWKALDAATTAKDPAAAMELLEGGFGAHHPDVAVGCGDVLATLGADVAGRPEVAKAIKRAIEAKDAKTQMNAARVLVAWGDPALDDSIAYLASGHRSTEVAAEALAMLGGLRESSVGKLAKTVESVLGGIRSKQPPIVRSACMAAARLRDSSFETDLVDVARHSMDPYEGLCAVRALKAMGVSGKVQSYVHVLEGGPKGTTVQACLKAVTDLSGPDDVDTLLSLTRATKKDQRDAACLALGWLAQDGKGPFGGPVITGDKPPVAPTAPTATTSKVVDRLVTLVAGEPEWEVRDAAARALQRIGAPAKPAIVERLAPLVDTSERDVALTCTELCGIFQVKEAYKAILKMAIFDKDLARRLVAARALQEIDPNQAVDDYMGDIAKDHKGRDTTLNMVRGLGYLRTEKAYNALLSFFDSTDWSEPVMRDVERALERITGHRFGRHHDRWNTWYATASAHDPFHPHLRGNDRQRSRRQALDKHLFGITETTERSLSSGLSWLEMQQHVTGEWDGNEKGFQGVVGCEPAYTGLALLAYLGAGYSPTEGRFRETVRRAADFLAATQWYDGGFPVSGGENSWVYAYTIGMGVWGLTEACGTSAGVPYESCAQRGVDYLARVQTPAGGWRYGPRYAQSDSSCTSWVLMAMKSAAVVGLHVPWRTYDSIDSWLERCQADITGQEERLDELMSRDYNLEVQPKALYKAFTGYFELSGKEDKALQMTSMTAAGMVCRIFMGWKRSHPFLIGSMNYLKDFLPQWRKGLEKGQAIAWYFYFYYYSTLAMHQMGGPAWAHWNEKIKTMLPQNQRKTPENFDGSWDPDTAVLNGGRLFSTSLACLTLETYYRFSPLSMDSEEEIAAAAAAAKKKAAAAAGGAQPAPAAGQPVPQGQPPAPAPAPGPTPAPGGDPAPAPAPTPAMEDTPAMDDAGMGDPAMDDAGMEEPAMGDAPAGMS